jgi:hypothetical protein
MSRLHRSIRTLAALGLVVAGVAACSGDEATAPQVPKLVVPAAPVAIINDGSRPGGNPNFFFLPPLVLPPQFDPDFDANKFNSSWKPVVQICRLGADVAAGCVTNWLRTYQGSEVGLSQSERNYYVLWNTRESWATPAKYRARVSVVGKDTVTLGFIDIAILTNLRGILSLVTNDIVPVPDNFLIPIRFRIENGATVSPGVPVFTETLVTNAGTVVRTGGTGAPGTLAINFPANWLPTGVSSAVVTVEKLSTGPGGPCLTSVPTLLQTSDCWRIETFPVLPRINQDVTVAFCPARLAPDPTRFGQTMYKFDAPDRLEALESVATTLVTCEPATGGIGSLPDNVFGRMRYQVARAANTLGSLLGPKSAYAFDAGYGGRVLSKPTPVEEGVFSEFFWGIPVRPEVTLVGEGALAVGAARTLRVRVLSEHGLEHDRTIGIPQVTVTPSGATGGTITPASAISDAAGYADFIFTPTAGGTASVNFGVPFFGEVTTATFTAEIAQAVTILLLQADITGTTQTVPANFISPVTISSNQPATVGCSLATSNPSIVNVDGLLVVATGTGTAAITATCGTAQASASFTVQPPLVRILSGQSDITGTTQTAGVGFFGNVSVTTNKPSANGCSLTSSNPLVVNTDNATAGFIVVATGPGTATLTATCGTTQASVTYVVPPPAVTISINNVVINGTTQQVTMPFTGNLSIQSNQSNVNCSVSANNPSVLSVSGYSVTAVGAGTASVSAICGQASASVTFSVTELPVGSIALRLASNTAPLYDRLSLNVNAGGTVSVLAQPLSAAGALLSTPCTWQDNAAGSSVDPVGPQRAVIAGVVPSGTAIGDEQVLVTCGGVTRTILVSVRDQTSSSRVDDVFLVWTTPTGQQLDPEVYALLPGTTYSVNASPVRLTEGGPVTVSNVSCGWSQTYGISFSAGPSLSVQATTQSQATAADNPLRVFVTCNGYTRELKFPLIG